MFMDLFLTKITLSAGTQFLVHSSTDEKNLRDMLPQAKITVHPMPAFTDFNRTNISKDEARKRLNLDDGKIALFFGFVRRYKGLEVVLKALPHVLNKMAIKLLVVGEFWKDKKHYLDLIDRLNIKDNVVLIDRFVNNEDVELYFNASDMVTLPYTSGTGSAILQMAYVFKKPVVATRVGSLTDNVFEGKTGFLVPPEDEKAFADAMIKLLHHEDLGVFSENIEKEMPRFSWDSLCDAIERT